MLRVEESGVVYRNPAPDLLAIHAALPFVGKLSDKEVLCFYRRGQTFVSADGNVARSRSTDGGKTWHDEGFVHDSHGDGRHYEYRAGGFGVLPDGTLLLALAGFERPSPEEPLRNPKTEGFRRAETFLSRSHNKGKTWSPLQRVPYPPGVVGNLSHGLRLINPGRLLLPIETWKEWDDPGPINQRVVGLFSHDGGKSWNEHAAIADGVAENILYWDIRVLPLPQDRVLAFFWTHNEKTDKGLPIHQAMSTDGGRTWSKPRSIGIEGQVCNIEDAGGGRIIMVYNRRYHQSPGIMAVLSTDENGLHWDMEHQTMVWDARVGSNVGTRSEESMLSDMATWAFGYPGVVRLRDGEFLVCFWATEACVTHIRWCRLRLA